MSDILPDVGCRPSRICEPAVQRMAEAAGAKDVAAVAEYLRDHVALHCEHERVGEGVRVNGEAFWLAVARAAVSLGARATKQPLHGPVRPLGER